MTVRRSTASANAALNAVGIKEQFDAGILYLFAGPVPNTADEALDMVNDHTQVVAISVNGDGTGLTFDAPVAGVLAKAAAENWTGTVAFDGADDAELSLQPSFFRFCAAGDTGRGAADGSTGYRIQGSVGPAASGADLLIGGTGVLEPTGAQPVGVFNIQIGG